MKRKALALLAAGVTVVSTGLVSAQSDSLAGIWEENIAFLDDHGNPTGRTGRSLVVYNKDGTLVATEAGSTTFDPSPQKNPHDPQTGLVLSNDIGLWVQVGDDHGNKTFNYTSYALFSDFSGNPVGNLTVTGHYTLTNGDTYEGYSFAEGDLFGETFKGYVTNHGERKPMLPPPPPPPQP
jgi:hypothetical protein